eukprot:7518921-Pyramimonas_sp.AAC.1
MLRGSALRGVRGELEQVDRVRGEGLRLGGAGNQGRRPRFLRWSALPLSADIWLVSSRSVARNLCRQRSPRRLRMAAPPQM